MTDPDDTAPRAHPPMLLWGFAPLVLAALLVVLAVLFVPSVAPEGYVPVVPASSTTTTAPHAEAGG